MNAQCLDRTPAHCAAIRSTESSESAHGPLLTGPLVLVAALGQFRDAGVSASLTLPACSEIAVTVIDRVFEGFAETGIRPLPRGTARGKFIVAP